ncbi:MAG: glycosyltransferase family 2 protein [Ignavibacteria bacterium CG_4_8_14_3_um_filter_37_9]|nr:glycosyltransferase family 2 protein [Ignavibacteria bacterium]OIO23306.1 MAG: glycosyl transferase [Ignavibacteria bacterium CG1_02_37_35]PIW99573.1 MAG: glycosyltransferase family 2 protein [Ignavibacteria bacterium CG_4_8_14_3_um_filter_37_9]PIX95485.1 MAG: glycosyltransferase family 2 protein [Ignavibacteria bacterium CG_4_10_14_3_um_filter_37_18]PJC59167.1 MAG: glycosyltransferase family 2 protein [Ignavibacteria bacterium CG_4_9_14_0_2_um_filter_37_13]
MNQRIKITVIIPCKNEAKFIGGCLDSVVKNDYPKDLLEVLVLDGESTDATQGIVKAYSAKFNFVRLVINTFQTVPYALNKGIKESTGDYIIRLDAHSEIPNNYFSTLIHWSKKLNADNIGAVCLTDIKNKNPKTISIAAVLSNKYGVGNSYFRIGVEKIEEVDHVPFGCFRKEIFNKVGLFNERLNRNQDIELSKRITRCGGRIFLLPDLFCTYYARETFWGIAKNNFGNGFWNILTVYVTRKINSLSWRHFIPFFFLLSLIIPFILMTWIPLIEFIAALSLGSYLLLVLSISWKVTNKTNSYWFILWTFIVLHFSYGMGSLVGFFRIDYLKKFKDD